MRIYLAADFARKEEINGYAEELMESGYMIVSFWHDPRRRSGPGFGIGGHEIPSGGHWIGNRMANDDFLGISSGELLVQFTTGELSRGGRHVELGIALGLGKMIVTVGPLEHAFHCLIADNYPTWDEFKSGLPTRTSFH